MDLAGFQEVAIPESSGNFFGLYHEQQASPYILVFHHATGFNAGTYMPLLQILAEKYEIVAYDARGHGQSSLHKPQIIDWNIFGSDLLVICEHYQKPAIAIGHSIGGVASIYAAVKKPSLFKQLILLDPTIFPPLWSFPLGLLKFIGKADQFPIAKQAKKRRFIWPSKQDMYNAYKNKQTFRNWQKEFLIGYLDYGTKKNGNGEVQLSCHTDWEAMIFAATPHNVWPFMKLLQTHTTIIYGGRSNTFRNGSVQHMKKKYPHIAMYKISDGDHFIPMQYTQQVAELIDIAINNAM